MIQRFSTNFGVFSFFLDLGSVFGAMHLMRLIRPFLSRFNPINPMSKVQEFPLFIYILVPMIWGIYLLSFSVYDGKKNLKVIDEFTNLTGASLLSAVTLAGVLYFSFREMSRAFFIFFVVITYMFLILWRVIARKLYKRRVYLKGYLPKIIIVGAGSVGLEFREKLKQLTVDTNEFVGFLDDSTEKQKSNQEVIGSIDEIRNFVQEKRIDSVIVSLPWSAKNRVDYVIDQLSDLPVRISMIPDYFQLALHRMTLSMYAGIPMLDLRPPVLTEYQRLVKRIFDVILSTLILIPALPVMVCLSLLIIIIDGFPFLLAQKRVGENGRIIKILKFRTMVQDADKQFSTLESVDSVGNVIYKKRDDPRVTPLGRILRRWSLDELPQLFNILRGTMSLVGPRPEIPALMEKYESWQRIRLSIPQGLTGWWQIQGRSDKPLHLNIEDDLYYIEHYSIWFDVMIIVKTIWIVLRGKGAY